MKNRHLFNSLTLILVVAVTLTLNAAQNPVRVLCFGDSITEGTHINGKWHGGNSWVNRLENRSGGTLKCINAGRSGRKTSQKQELLPFLKKQKDIDVVILYLGVNDLRVPTEKVLTNCVVNTEWMINKARDAYGEQLKIIILGSPGINASKMIPHFYKMGYDEKEQAMLNRLRPLYKKLAEKKHCDFLDLWGVVSPQNYHEGLHPNIAGQTQTAEAIWIYYINNGKPAKVACVGDSITFGAGIKNRAKNSYPAQLQKMLGDRFIVKNFGFSARTLLDEGDHPYRREKMYKNALNLNPNYVIIKLGTNDTKPHNWKYKDRFEPEMKAFAESFANLPSRPKVFLSTPVPVQQDKWGINEKSITNGVIPAVIAASEELNLPLIDFHSALPAERKYYIDGVHPNPAGAKIMAITVWEAIMDRPANDLRGEEHQSKK